MGMEMKRTHFAIALACFLSLTSLYSTDSITHRRVKAKRTHLSAKKKKNVPIKNPQDLLRKIVGADFGERSGLVLNTTTIPLVAPYANYNPSVVPFGDGYLMCFRHDIPDPNTLTNIQRRSLIGLVRLNASFRPIEDPKYLHLEERFRDCEDTRLFYVGERLYITCCVFFPAQEISKIAVGEIDRQTLEAQWITTLDNPNPRKIEKNWTPVAYTAAPGKTDLYFLYSLDPHVVLQTTQEAGSARFAATVTQVSSLPVPKLVHQWTKKWGFISGGTPTIQLGDKYLTFFHSHFYTKGQVWYVMGAAILDGHPPFRTLKMSTRPILFRKMYAAPHHPDPLFRLFQAAHVVFPSGLVEGRYKDKSVFHVFYGDNDRDIGIVTIDKTKLLKSLQVVK
jgi:predicted GH43/DUF377 family glycosyl hydrolase